MIRFTLTAIATGTALLMHPLWLVPPLPARHAGRMKSRRPMGGC